MSKLFLILTENLIVKLARFPHALPPMMRGGRHSHRGGQRGGNGGAGFGLAWQDGRAEYRGGGGARGRGAARLLGHGRVGQVRPTSSDQAVKSVLDADKLTHFLQPKARSLVKVPDSFDNVQQYCSLIAHNMVCAARCFHPLLACAFSACFMFVDTDVMLQNPFSWQSSGTCTAKDLEDQSFKVSWSVMHAPFPPPIAIHRIPPRETIVCLVF